MAINRAPAPTDAEFSEVPTTRKVISVASPYPFLSSPLQPDEIGRLGNYRVLHLLSQGGMAFVFLAEDLYLRRRVALKVMKPTLDSNMSGAQRFLREARTLASIKHDHVVTVYQVGQEPHTVFLAMEWLQGQNLEDWVTTHGGPPTLNEILRFAREIASGLNVIHRNGLIHRDLKPSNLWVEEPGRRIKLLDFGLARTVENNHRFTGTGFILGTPGYMSPEQARGESMDARSDLFSFGAVLYFLCSGKQPFESASTVGTLTSVVLDSPTPLIHINRKLLPSLSDLIMQLLEKKPADRPATAQEVLDRLESMEKTLAASDTSILTAPVVAELDQPVKRPRRLVNKVEKPRQQTPAKRRLKRTLMAVLGLTAVLAIPTGLYFGYGAPNESIPPNPGANLPTVAIANPTPLPKAKGILVLDDCEDALQKQSKFEDNLTLVDPSGDKTFRISGFNTCLAFTGGRMVAVDAKREWFWVLENSAKRVRKFDYSGKVILSIGLTQIGNAIAIDPETGNLWVALGGEIIYSGKTVVYSSTGELVATYPVVGLDIVYDPTCQAFWMVTAGLEKVSAKNGQVLKSTPIQCWATSSVEVDTKTGDVWVAVRSHPDVPTSRNELLKFNNEGKLQLTIPLIFKSPFKLSLDQKTGNLWAANIRDSIQKFSREGKLLNEFPSISLTVQADPFGEGVWLATPDEIHQLDANGKVIKHIRHEKHSIAAWMAVLE